MRIFFRTGGVPGRVLLRVLAPLAGLAMLTVGASAQTTSFCNTAGTVPLAVSSTGLAETVGDVVISCTGGSSGAQVIASVFVSLNTNITNTLDPNGNPLNIAFSASGTAVTADAPVLSSSTTLKISNIIYTVPAPNAIPVVIRISGIRAAVASIQNGVPPTLVSASVAAVGFSLLGGSQVAVALGSTPFLLASVLNNGISCNGSPLPSTIDFPGFISAGTMSSAVRVTEAAPNALIPKDPTSNSGTRILVRLTGYGAGVRLFVPDAIVGNSGSLPTAAGEFASSVASGSYVPNANQLLLTRVAGADQNGGGGTLVVSVPTGGATYTAMSELTVSGGSAYAVYEVLDDSPYVTEAFHVPVFVVTAPNNCASSPQTFLSAMLAPISTVSIATATDPVPRFISAVLASDCQQTGDCNANYFPVLSVDTTPISLAGASLGDPQKTVLTALNSGGSQLNLNVSISYQTGSNWLTVTPTPSAGNIKLTISADPSTLQAGSYTATIALDAGAAGAATIPVTFTVGAPGVTVQGIVNAASFQTGAIAPGSYVALFGLNLGGTNVSVTFNGLNATIVYASPGQVNLIVPAALSGQASATVVVKVDGKASNTFIASLAANLPAIFTPGMVNSDGSINTAARPAKRGSIVQVYLTGLAIPLTGAVTVNMGGQNGIIPGFAGAQPTLPALDQVNVTVPASLTLVGNSVPLSVCVSSTGAPICSNSVSLFLQ